MSPGAELILQARQDHEAVISILLSQVACARLPLQPGRPRSSSLVCLGKGLGLGDWGLAFRDPKPSTSPTHTGVPSELLCKRGSAGVVGGFDLSFLLAPLNSTVVCAKLSHAALVNARFIPDAHKNSTKSPGPTLYQLLGMQHETQTRLVLIVPLK